MGGERFHFHVGEPGPGASGPGGAFATQAAPRVADFDGVWKQALRNWLPECLALLWPHMYDGIDWSFPPVFLDKELKQLGRIVRKGSRHVDVLVQLALAGGNQVLLLIHLEVQAGHVPAEFSWRMFQYYGRLREHHPEHQVLSCAILLDHENGPDVGTFRSESLGCELVFRFPVVRLANWRGRMAELQQQAHTNPFAVVVLAQLEYRATQPDAGRLAGKLALARALAKWNYHSDTRRALFLILDSLLVLPEELNDRFLEALEAEEPEMMQQMNSYERFLLRREKAAGMEEGMQKGRAEGAAVLLCDLLLRKFGSVPEWASDRIAQADAVVLEQWALNVLDAQAVEEVFRD